MNKQINRNLFWAEKIVQQLYNYGVRDVCISPGSRNTPLTLAFAANKKIKKHVIIDERSSGFFALGISKLQKSLTAVLTTSGTAVAELYPAIIEAYFEKIPLIIITADRPHYLRNSGANQTINQDNIFHNHIRAFADLGLPNLNYKSFQKLRRNIDNVFEIIFSPKSGPVHFNVQFEKPFEPSNITDNIDEILFNKANALFDEVKTFASAEYQMISKNILNLISGAKKILIISGNNCESTEKVYLAKIADYLKAPVITGILSSLRLDGNCYCIKNASSFLRDGGIKQKVEPDLILQFGFASISNSILDFIAQSRAVKVSINPYNEKYDPSLTTKYSIQSTAEKFYQSLLFSKIKKTDLTYVELLRNIDSKTQYFKNDFVQRQTIIFEWKIYNEVLKSLPEESNLMISNSLAIRDFDYLVDENKKINIFSNRGASGIDGIISTAAGIYKSTKTFTYLIIGDLAFLYDLNALHLINQKNIPLKIILINNNGGGIFDLLPIAKEKIDFVKYFKTPIDISFKGIVKSFNGNYSNPKTLEQLKTALKSIISSEKFSVIEFNINSTDSAKMKLKFWKQLAEYLNL